MNPRSGDEYQALRATIRERGTARVWVFFAGITVWAGLTLGTLLVELPPAVTLIPLLALAATFEAVLTLHVGVERIGRYLLVFHDDEWERAAGTFGKPPGAVGVDPLFTPFFLLAALLTPLASMATALTAPEVGGLLVAEAAFIVRVISARLACGRQRAIDAERFSSLKTAK